ncbi:hypothetical protein ANN_20853 [Periplaneta americana]|uniref:GBD/FH3 domain-containing protein n=1 Tax=Periplaneta americana TaxID=6978 RepID=A0ABQ8SDS2_PERAM|nr:hypothetical protein ANN_20853 [Periplaneta americana]
MTLLVLFAPQEDKDLVHEFVQNDGLACLIKVGSEADQNYQNYILREVQVLRDKFQNVFGKNSAQVLEGVPVGEIDGVCVCDIPLFKYARLTSCDVERSFSQYKSLFRDNRHAFVMENLEMTFVVHCNSRPTTSTQVWLTLILARVRNMRCVGKTQNIAAEITLGQVMLYVDGMNGVMEHNETVQWLYALIASKFRLVVKTALKLLLVFVEYVETNCLLLIKAVHAVDTAHGLLPWSNIVKLLKDYDAADTELLIYAMTLVNKTLNGTPDQDTYYDQVDALEEQGIEGTIQRYKSAFECNICTMEAYCFVELADMHLVYGAANGNSRAAERLIQDMMAKPLISLFKFESIYVAHSVNLDWPEYMSKQGTDLDLLRQFQIYEAVLHHEDGEEKGTPLKQLDETVRKTLRNRKSLTESMTAERRKSRRHSTGTSPMSSSLGGSMRINNSSLQSSTVADDEESESSSSRSSPGPELNGSYKECKAVQKNWDEILISLVKESLQSSFSSDTDRPRFLALQQNVSGSWLHVIPSSNIGTLMDHRPFKVSVALCLGCKICHIHKCICGNIVDSYCHHALSCVMSKRRLSRHSSLNDIIKRALTSSGVPSILEPSGISHSDGKRPDGLTLVPWRVGKSLIWDSTCVDTLAPSHLSSTSKTPGSAAESAAVSKHHKYKHLADNYIFVPFAVETFGSWCIEAKALISTIGRSLVQLSGDPRSSQYLHQRIGITIQCGNATSILASFPESSYLDGIFFL